MRRVLGFLLVLMLVAAACGDDDGADFSDPASLDTCEAVADASADLLQETIDIMDSMTAEELAALGESEDTPEAFQEVETQGMALEARAAEIGCSEEEFASLVAERAADLTAESPLGQLILEGIKSGESLFGE